MNKIDTINSIEKVINFHQKRMQLVEILLSGKTINEVISTSKIESDFGAWLYTPENNLHDTLGAQFYDMLDKSNADWHDKYDNIHDIFFVNKRKGILSRLFKRKKIEHMKMEKAKLYYIELQESSNTLLKALASCQRRATALNESMFIRR